ncbi:MAG: capsule assembly Wzi family protein [Gemmatimonadales bacterium]
MLLRRLSGPALVLALLAIPSIARAQGSPYLTLDDPDLPLLEHLISRGDVADPSPFVRPFTRRDATRVLRGAQSSADAALVARLLKRWELPEGESTWRAAGRVGAQGYGAARRDALQPSGEARAGEFYGEAALSGTFGAVVVGSRVVAENRLKDDPDWTGDAEQRSKHLALRAADAYVAAQWRLVHLHLGQVDRNWGPAGVAGLGVSNVGYPRPDLSLELVTSRLTAQFVFTPLPSERLANGNLVERYAAAHRIGWRPSTRFEIGAWETMILADEAENGTNAIGSLFSVMTFAAQFGRKANTNSILGLDARWRATPRLQFEAQFAGDDIRLGSTNSAAGEANRPNRYAFTMGARGALPRGLSWRAHYVRVSSLAYRTSNPLQNFTADGVGTVRIIPDNDELTGTIGVPVAHALLLSPSLSWQRQGEGRLDVTPPFNASTPTFLIGTVRRTLRAAVGLSGGVGPAKVLADVGVNRVRNADQVVGRSTSSLEGRVIVTIGGAAQGRLQ